MSVSFSFDSYIFVMCFDIRKWDTLIFCSQDYFVYLESLGVPSIFLDLFFFFQFYETDVNILIGGAVNFSLDLGRVEMSIVLSL